MATKMVVNVYNNELKAATTPTDIVALRIKRDQRTREAQSELAPCCLSPNLPSLP
jgi:hypothetical protein